jgi:hypothetical protein
MFNRIFLNLQSKLGKRICKILQFIIVSVLVIYVRINCMSKKNLFHSRSTKVRIQAERFVANHSLVSLSEYWLYRKIFELLFTGRGVCSVKFCSSCPRFDTWGGVLLQGLQNVLSNSLVSTSHRSRFGKRNYSLAAS